MLARNTDAPVPAPMSASSMIVEDARRVPAVDEVDVLAQLHRREHRAEHAGRVRDRRAHEVRRAGRDPRPHVRELGEQRAVGVHHALRVARRARRVREHAHVVADRPRRRTPAGAAAVDDVPRDAPHAAPPRRASARSDDDVQLEIGQLVGRGAVDDVEVVDVAVAIGGDVRARAALAEDEAHFLGAVDVHDRHEDVAAQREAVERDDGLAPVRQLERDDGAGLEPGRGRAR